MTDSNFISTVSTVTMVAGVALLLITVKFADATHRKIGLASLLIASFLMVASLIMIWLSDNHFSIPHIALGVTFTTFLAKEMIKDNQSKEPLLDRYGKPLKEDNKNSSSGGREPNIFE